MQPLDWSAPYNTRDYYLPPWDQDADSSTSEAENTSRGFALTFIMTGSAGYLGPGSEVTGSLRMKNLSIKLSWLNLIATARGCFDRRSVGRVVSHVCVVMQGISWANLYHICCSFHGSKMTSHIVSVTKLWIYISWNPKRQKSQIRPVLWQVRL